MRVHVNTLIESWCKLAVSTHTYCTEINWKSRHYDAQLSARSNDPII